MKLLFAIVIFSSWSFSCTFYWAIYEINQNEIKPWFKKWFLKEILYPLKEKQHSHHGTVSLYKNQYQNCLVMLKTKIHNLRIESGA